MRPSGAPGTMRHVYRRPPRAFRRHRPARSDQDVHRCSSTASSRSESGRSLSVTGVSRGRVLAHVCHASRKDLRDAASRRPQGRPTDGEDRRRTCAPDPLPDGRDAGGKSRRVRAAITDSRLRLWSAVVGKRGEGSPELLARRGRSRG